MSTRADTDKRAMARVHANHRDMVMTWDEINDELIWDEYDPEGPEHQPVSPERLEAFCLRFPHFEQRLRWFVERWNKPDARLIDEELAAIEVKPEEIERAQRFAFWCIRFYDKLRHVEAARDELGKALAECCDTVEAWAPEQRADAVKRQLSPFRAALKKHGIKPSPTGAPHAQDRHRS